MLVSNYTEFRTELKKFLDDVEHKNETLIVKRGGGKGAVVISLEEYNSIMETIAVLKNDKAEGALKTALQMEGSLN